MDKVELEIKLRPIRFLFLVRPNDKKNLEKIFQINTLLWGGKFNPIVPFFKRVPKWWNNPQSYSAKQILENHLDFYEPDFIVESELGMANNFDFDKERVIRLEDLLNDDDYGVKDKYGLTVKDWYSHLYEKKYQFERRHKPSFINVKSDKKNLKLLASCLFGAFPEESRLEYFQDGYLDIFEAKEVELNTSSFIEIHKGNNFSPLDITHGKIDVTYSEPPPSPKIFIFDLDSAKDLIDYWNLRTIYRNVLAIPKQWLPELADLCNSFIEEQYRPRHNQHEFLFKTYIMFSRSLTEQEGKQIYNEYLAGNDKKAVLQFWYPNIKVDHSNNYRKLQRTILTYQEVRKDIAFFFENDKRQLRFETLAPEFLKEKYYHKLLWANVITIKDRSLQNHIANCFPTNFRNPKFPKFGFYREFILSTSEGLIVFPERVNQNLYWHFPRGTEFISQWLERINVKSQVSDAGKATQQIIETIGGIRSLYSLANEQIIRKLDEMARNLLTSSFHSQKFHNQIKHISNESRAKFLISRNVVQLGLELKCYKCDSWSWYKVNQVNYQVSCNRCLKDFNFPATDPNNSNLSRWAYRVIGAFALPDYARGGYSASLAIHFFIRKIDFSERLKVTWSAGQELTFSSGKKAEADFILWSQSEEIFGLNQPTDIIFGEAKSFAKDAFKKDDFEKMKLIAENFPKSIIVFAAMKSIEKFSPDEIDRLRKFAEWGRGYDNKNKEVRAYVMVLTGLELFIDDYNHILNIWEKKGGKYEKISKKLTRSFTDLKLFAELTQELYLDMPSYYEGLYNIKL